MWFKELTGFHEISPNDVRTKLYIDGKHIVSKVNGKSYQVGVLKVPMLSELRVKSQNLPSQTGRIMIDQVVGNVQDLHRNPENQHALFQAASQFNLLEMVNPQITPESGIDSYENDHTQGPQLVL